MQFSDLYNEIKESADKKIWARGLEIARRKDVRIISPKNYVVIEKISASDHEVRLDPIELDWVCTCASESDPCEHVSATMVAIKMEAEKNIPIEAYMSKQFSVQYELRRASNNYLVLDRKLVKSGDGQPETAEIKHSLLSIVSGRIEGPNISAKPYDLEIDRVLTGDFGARIDGYISSVRAWSLLFPHLASLQESHGFVFEGGALSFNNKKKAAEILELSPSIDGYILTLKSNDRVLETYANGVCLYEGDHGQELRIIAKNDLPETILADLRLGRHFSQNEKVELFSKLLPELKKRFKVLETGVEAKATYAPMGFCVKNKIVGPRKVETSFHISYGDPVKAYLSSGELVCLGNEVPLRKIEREDVKRREFEREFGYELSKSYVYENEKIFDWISKISRFHLNFIGDSLDTLKVLGKSKILTKLLGEDIDFAVEVEGEKIAVDPQDLLEAYEKDTKFIKTEKGYVEVKTEWLDEYHDLIRSFMIAKNGRQAKGVSALESIRIIEGFGFSPPKKLKAYKDNLFTNTDQIDLSIVHAELREYQKEGVNWLYKLKEANLGALLADDMGLGKTIQSIAVFKGRTLIICPTSLVFNWKNELEIFRPDLSVSVFHGASRELNKKSDIVITTYGILRSDIENLCEETWSCVCIDEAQVIKNPQSKATQALWKIKSDFRLALTGTPIENHYKDLWSIFNFIAPGLLGELSYFNKFIVKPIQAETEGILSGLRARISPFILRRTKSDVLLELPDKTEVINYCEMSEAQNKSYEDYLSGVKSKISSEEIKPIQIFELILRLRQFACDPRLVDKNYSGGSGKIDVFRELIREVVDENHKSLVFSQWTSFLDLISDELLEMGIQTYRLDGSTRNREEVVASYNNDTRPCVFLLSLKAGGVGLNLTSADHVFLLDPWWNPATERQAIDRAHRIGQENPVMIHRLVGKDTIEEKVIKLQKIKETMSDSILQDMDSAVVSKRDLLELLE